MNASIHDQLHDYVDDVISQSVPVDLDDITGGRRTAKPVGAVQPASKPAKARRRSWLAVAVAAGAVFVVIGGTTLLMRTFTSNTDVGTTPTPAPDALPNAIPSLLTWTRITDDDVFGDKVAFTAGMRDVTVGGPGLVAVGEADDGAGVWTSIDGITWSRVTDNESAFAGIDTMWSVAAGERGL
ncbi:MAG: hypothetical protein M3132_07300, partial [Actinomycetia bacterium]|nr:hypothetical protein [Actinomycetes bacterium]